MPHLKIIDVVLVYCNIANNDFQQDSRLFYGVIPNRSFSQSVIKNSIFLKTFNSECLYIEVWFADQNSKPIEIDDKINITLVIK